VIVIDFKQLYIRYFIPLFLKCCIYRVTRKVYSLCLVLDSTVFSLFSKTTTHFTKLDAQNHSTHFHRNFETNFFHSHQNAYTNHRHIQYSYSRGNLSEIGEMSRTPLDSCNDTRALATRVT